nr:MAG TPA: H-type lectin domain [Caudoviricetes sp.]
MALGFPNSNGGRTTDSALFHALGNAFVGSWISGFRVRQASPVGMNVLIGGESGIPDDLLVRDAMSATFPVSNLSTQPVQASVTTANSANPRIDAVVIYIDTNVAASQVVANNENRTKAVVVPGTPATNPSAPTPSQIKAKIGVSNPYEVIAEIRVNAGTTTILDSVITDRRNPATLADGRINRVEMFKNGVIGSDALGNDIVLPRHLKWSDFVQSKRNNASKSSSSITQHGVAMLNVPSNALEATIQIAFPKQFKTIPTVVCSFGGYGPPGEGWTDTPNSSWGGCAFSAVGVTNTSFTARCRRFDGAQLLGTYYVNWIAIGSV